jgi:hypothetical protein
MAGAASAISMVGPASSTLDVRFRRAMHREFGNAS